MTDLDEFKRRLGEHAVAVFHRQAALASVTFDVLVSMYESRTHPPAASEREGEAADAALWRFVRDNRLQYFEPNKHWLHFDGLGILLSQGQAESYEQAARAALDAQRLGREKGEPDVQR